VRDGKVWGSEIQFLAKFDSAERGYPIHVAIAKNLTCQPLFGCLFLDLE